MAILIIHFMVNVSTIYHPIQLISQIKTSLSGIMRKFIRGKKIKILIY